MIHRALGWHDRHSSLLRYTSGILIVLAACHSARPSRDAHAEVIAALARYSSLIQMMAHDSIAQTFTPDGESSDADQPPIRGQAAIRAHMMEFSEYKVLANRLEADTTRIAADTAWQAGTYWQRVRVPAGDTVEVGGRFSAIWLQTTAGQWRLRRLRTFRLAP